MDLAGAGSATDEDSARGALADAGGRRRWERRGRWCGVSMMRSVHVGKQRSGGGGGRGAIGVGREEETQAAVQRDGASWASQTGAGAESAAAQVVAVVGGVRGGGGGAGAGGGWRLDAESERVGEAACCMLYAAWRLAAAAAVGAHGHDARAWARRQWVRPTSGYRCPRAVGDDRSARCVCQPHTGGLRTARPSAAGVTQPWCLLGAASVCARRQGPGRGGSVRWLRG